MKANDVIKVKVKSLANGVIVEDIEKVLPVGRGYVLKQLDDSFIKHKIGDSYSIDLTVDEAYGHRKRELLRMIPVKYFKSNNINPYKGLVLNIDGLLGKVISVSPGRVMVDFNHPLAGKDLHFDIKINGLIKDVITIAESIIKFFVGDGLKVSKEGDNIVIKDTIKVPESIKDKLTLELTEVLGLKSIKNIKFIS